MTDFICKNIDKWIKYEKELEIGYYKAQEEGKAKDFDELQRMKLDAKRHLLFLEGTKIDIDRCD